MCWTYIFMRHTDSVALREGDRKLMIILHVSWFMGAFEIHQYQSALLGIINTTMSTKVTGNYSMTDVRNKKNELPK